MMRSLCRQLLIAALLIVSLSAHATPTHCDVCGRVLNGQYWNYQEQVACSQGCIDVLRPICSVCDQTIRGEYREMNGKVYCGEACFKSTLPKCEICNQPIAAGFEVGKHRFCKQCVDTQPTCFSCGLPASHPRELKDGRTICYPCMRWAVKKQSMAEQHYDLVRKQIEAWTALTLDSVPKLKLVDKKKMDSLSGDLRKTDSPVSIRGLYSRQVTMTRKGVFGKWKAAPELDRETIYIVDYLRDEVFRVAATHELMHDLIHEHFPRLKDAPLWVHEGICQQAAAEYCRRRNYGDILHGIEHCEDPDYGDGYRYINRLMGFEGWRALKRWMDTVDLSTLPQVAPK